VHRQIAIGRLPDIERAVPRHKRMGREQHEADGKQAATRDEKRDFRFPWRCAQRALAREEESRSAQQTREHEPQYLRGQIEPHREREQRGEPDQHRHAEREAEPNAHKRLFAIEQQTAESHAGSGKQGNVENRQKFRHNGSKSPYAAALGLDCARLRMKKRADAARKG